MTSTAALDTRPKPRPSGQGNAVLKLYLADTQQLFNSMDPAPFNERDLDPVAAAYITDWAEEAPADQPLSLVVHLGRQPATADDTTLLADAVHEHFRRRAVAARKRLQRLLRIGRISLVIGLLFLAAAIGLGELVGGLISSERYASLAKESLVIGGWVALWRPMEIFLYDWWPIRVEARLCDRLSTMDVSVSNGAAGT